MAQPATGLKAKHWKALELFEESILTFKEIALTCNIAIQDIYDLFEGNAQRVGTVAHLFKAEADKITVRNAIKIRQLTKDNKKIALYMMNDRLKELKKKKTRNKLDSNEVSRILTTLTKATPSVEIGSFSITKGLTQEEIVEEFKRLNALAQFALERGRIQRSGKGKPGELPGPTPGGDPLPEE